VAAWSKALVCGRLFSGFTGSNKDDSVDVCLLCVLFVGCTYIVTQANHSLTRPTKEGASSECYREAPYGEALTFNQFDAPQGIINCNRKEFSKRAFEKVKSVSVKHFYC
jgi:hypothetical protein